MRHIALFALSFVAGLGIPLMAALNASMSDRLGSPFRAALVLLVSAMTASAMFAGGGGLITAIKMHLRPVDFAAGLMLIFYLASAAVSAPRIGVGNFVLMVLVGQVCMSALIDQTGLAGMPVHSLRPVRLFGLGLVVIGALFARTPSPAV